MELGGPKGIDDALASGAQITTHPFSKERPRPLPLVREVGEASKYPIHALGSTLAPVAERLMKAIQAPAAICCQSVLAAINLAVQGHADVVLDGRSSPLSLFLLTIGESGERKSAVDREALRAHRAYEKELAHQYKAALEEHKNLKLLFEKRREEALKTKASPLDADARRNALQSIGREPDAPLLPILIAEEPSYEGLIKLIACGQPSLGLFSAEGGRLIGGYSMSQDQQLKTAAGLSELWDGDRISRVRSGDGAFVLHGRRLALALMAQPGVALSLVNNPVLVEQGLNSRILTTWPTSTAGSRAYQNIDLSIDPVVTAFHDKITSILETTLPLAEGAQNELVPRALGVDAAAKACWVAAYDSIETQLLENGRYSSIRGLANKAPEHVLRIAGTLAMFRDLGSRTISAEDIQAAIELVEHYLDEAIRIRSAASIDPDLEVASKVMAWARRRPKGRFHLAQLYQLGPNPVRDAKFSRKIIEILEEHYQLLRLPENSKFDGRRAKEAWEVNDQQALEV